MTKSDYVAGKEINGKISLNKVVGGFTKWVPVRRINGGILCLLVVSTMFKLRSNWLQFSHGWNHGDQARLDAILKKRDKDKYPCWFTYYSYSYVTVYVSFGNRGAIVGNPVRKVHIQSYCHVWATPLSSWNTIPLKYIGMIRACFFGLLFRWKKGYLNGRSHCKPRMMELTAHFQGWK